MFLEVLLSAVHLATYGCKKAQNESRNEGNHWRTDEKTR